MHAAMLVNTYYSPAVDGDLVALSAMISIIAIEMLILMIVVMSSARIAAAH